MEVKHSENTGSDKQTTILSVLEDPKVLYKLIEAGTIPSATESWSSLGGYSAQHHIVVDDGGKNIIEQKLHESLGRHNPSVGTGPLSWKAEAGLILIHSIQNGITRAEHLNTRHTQTRVCWCSPASGSKRTVAR